MACLVLAIGAVMAAEALNTAVEKLCDFAQKNQNRYIRFVKDVAAGAVLLSAVGALLAGVFILFRPELWRLLWGILGHPPFTGAFGAVPGAGSGFCLFRARLGGRAP